MYYITNNRKEDIIYNIDGEKFVIGAIKKYSDTGNVISSNITEVSENDYEKLTKNEKFNQRVKVGDFIIETTNPKNKGINEVIAKKEKAEKGLKEANKEIEELKKKLKEQESINKEQKEENDSLKARLNNRGRKASAKIAGEEGLVEDIKDLAEEVKEIV